MRFGPDTSKGEFVKQVVLEYAPDYKESDRKKIEAALRRKGISIVRVRFFGVMYHPRVRIGGKIFLGIEQVAVSLDEISTLAVAG